MTLRPYQVDMIDRVRAEMRTHDAVLLQCPTGSGKTVMAAHMLQSVVAKGKRGIFLTHRIEILDQVCTTFRQFSIPHGVISAGYTPHLMMPIQVASIDTLRSRLASGRIIPRPDLVIVDECHHCVSPTWSKVKKQLGGKVVGLSATPERLDGRGLGTEFSSLVCGPSVAELMDDGFLCRYRAFAPSTPDMTGIHTRMGDFVRGEMAEQMDRPTITGDAVSHYLKLARGKKAIAYCISIEHSKHVVEQFRAQGVVAWHIDGETDRGERRQATAAFARGEIQVLSNVDLISEGYDCPSADASILLRPTKSLALYLQQCGRVLRPSDGKRHALLLDHAGNIQRHGLPDDDREWSLDGREARKRASDDAVPPVRQCPRCYHCHRPAPVCPACGWSYEAKARQVDEVDGQLEEIDLEAQRRERKAEQAKATTLADLIEIGKKRGYQSPEKWASHLFTARLAKQGLEKWRNRS